MKRRILSIALALCLCISILPAAHAADNPTEAEVYDILIAFKTTNGYTEGTPWTDNTPYSLNNPYVSNIKIGNVIQTGTGCAAFAFFLSDAAFGNLPGRQYDAGSFDFEDLRVGDILRVNNKSHSVIILQRSPTGIVIAEGNYNSSVHWERVMSKEEVMSTTNFMITRYPEGYDPGTNPDDPIQTGAQGTTGSLSWKVTNSGTLSITGSGAMPDYSSASNQPWYAYASRILNVEIGSGVTRIGNNAFYDFQNLISATIANTVTSIGETAFRGCTGLKTIELPASVTLLGSSVFMECTALTTVTFASGTATVEMGEDLFARCYELSSVTLPQKVDCISKEMFTNCLKLTSIVIPEGVTSIEESAFASCIRLSSVWIPDSVTTIGRSAFASCSALSTIDFGGSESQWSGVSKVADSAATLASKTINYNVTKPSTPVNPVAHVHSWSSAWSSNSSYHWHECTAATTCTITANSGKDGYGAHTYGEWVVDQEATAAASGSRHRTCSICGYVQTETIPAAGSPAETPSTPSNPTSPSNPTTPSTPSTSTPSTNPSTTTPSTSTTQNPDGSTTTTHTDKATGTVTETTQNRDGSRTVVETKTDGTVTTTQTDRSGNVTETVAMPNGSSTMTVERTDGVTATIQTSASGAVEAAVSLPSSVVSSAQRTGEAVALPIPEVRMAASTASAAAVTVNTGSQTPVKVEIPTTASAPGAVAVIVHADGSEEIVKTSVPTANGVEVALSDGATVKIVDNSKDFSDVSAQNWAADAVDFVSARELFSGTTETTFTPDAPMTRAMLIVVLARFDGADTASGANWYEQGVAWAAANNISDGSGLDESVTREQLVTMLWRYAGSPSASGALPGFTDAGRISDYAQEAMRWAVENGIVSGFENGQLEPQGQATRAQVAQMLMNFIES